VGQTRSIDTAFFHFQKLNVNKKVANWSWCGARQTQYQCFKLNKYCSSKFSLLQKSTSWPNKKNYQFWTQICYLHLY